MMTMSIEPLSLSNQPRSPTIVRSHNHIRFIRFNFFSDGHLATTSEELEQQNILEADAWASFRRRDPVKEPFGRNLHRRMFGDVWRWAGTYRTSNKNLGVERSLISDSAL